MRTAQYELDTQWLVKGKIDEVSILFKNETEMDGLLLFCRGNGVRHHKTVYDNCVQLVKQPDGMVNYHPCHGYSFSVRFDFLTIPGTDWRIEAMCVTEGEAPLHEEARNHEIVHASFKCADFAHYLHTVDVLGHQQPVRYEYRNSYGVFGYFGAWTPYLKPRVNLRDAPTAQPA